MIGRLSDRVLLASTSAGAPARTAIVGRGHLMYCAMFALASLWPSACSLTDSTKSAQSSCKVGAETCPCTAGGGCDPGLSCLSNTCVRSPPIDAVDQQGAAGSAAQQATAGAVSVANACPIGARGCACTSAMTCDPGLTCLGSYCAAQAPPAGGNAAPPASDQSIIVDCNTAEVEYANVSAQLAEKLSATPEFAAEIQAAARDDRVPVLPDDTMRLYDRANRLLDECPFEVCSGILATYSECLAGQAEDAFGDSVRMCDDPPLQCQPFQ